MLLLAGMGPPGGGRTVISPRLQSRFNLINMTFPSVDFNCYLFFWIIHLVIVFRRQKSVESSVR